MATDKFVYTDADLPGLTFSPPASPAEGGPYTTEDVLAEIRDMMLDVAARAEPDADGRPGPGARHQLATLAALAQHAEKLAVELSPPVLPPRA